MLEAVVGLFVVDESEAEERLPHFFKGYPPRVGVVKGDQKWLSEELCGRKSVGGGATQAWRGGGATQAWRGGGATQAWRGGFVC